MQTFFSGGVNHIFEIFRILIIVFKLTKQKINTSGVTTHTEYLRFHGFTCSIILLYYIILALVSILKPSENI